MGTEKHVIESIDKAGAREDLVAGMRGLCAAINNLAEAQRKLEAIEPGKNLDVFRLHLQRLCNHLAEAHGDAPDQAWAVLLAASDSTLDELMAAMEKKLRAA